MASNDWVVLASSLGGADVAKGVTSGVAKPGGGGGFCYVMNALTATVGGCGLYASPQAPNTNFNPLLKGCDMSGAIQRGIANGLTGYSCWIFALAQGTAITNTAYMLGLSDGNPCHIELRKGSMQNGLPDEAPGGPNVVLARSTQTVEVGEWIHLRMEVICNPSGDTVINCFQSDSGDVTSPNWIDIPGIPGGPSFVDDVAGINSGSLPFVGGRAGFAAQFAGATRNARFDHMRLLKQT
jgi:hypothetical protein